MKSNNTPIDWAGLASLLGVVGKFLTKPDNDEHAAFKLTLKMERKYDRMIKRAKDDQEEITRLEADKAFWIKSVKDSVSPLNR